MKTTNYFKKESEAILNDDYRQKLFKELFELYSKSKPIILRKENGDIQCMFDDDVEVKAEKIRELIRFRDSQIFKSIRK